MRTSTVVWVIVVIIIIGGLAWYFMAGAPQMAPASQTGTQASTTTETTTDGTAAAPAAAVATAGSLGSILTTQSGMTLYTYSNDTSGVSNCSGQCSVNWPPLTVAAGAQVGATAGATGAWGTIVRADGTTQVTYNGAPLYTYVKDTQPGQTNGQGVGGVWYVAQP